MHAHIHLRLHTDRAAELRDEAGTFRIPRPRLRTRVGWAMVEVGLRLTQSGGAGSRHTNFRTA